MITKKIFSRALLHQAFLISLLLLLCQQANAQGYSGTYLGRFSLPAGSKDKAAFYQNSLTIVIDKTGQVNGKIVFRGGSASEPDEWVKLSGDFRGNMEGSSIQTKGNGPFVMLDNKQEKTSEMGYRISGTFSIPGKPSHISGSLFVQSPGGSESKFLTFTADPSAEEGLRLTFPLGESPSVFDKGWKFAAECILNPGTDEEQDHTNSIKWSGTATFNPSVGPLSSPVFNSTGANKIILTVKDSKGNTLEKEYKIDVVPSAMYAHTGCLAIGSSDSHGCMACPHPVVGYITGSADDVTINSLAVACVGDRGTHVCCCGTNTFVLNEGDPRVLIHGKKVVMLGMSSDHCGGKGRVEKCMPHIGQLLVANDSVFYIDDWGKLSRYNAEKYGWDYGGYVGKTYVTKAKGLFTMSLLPKGELTAGPNSRLTVLSDQGGKMRIRVEKGTIMFNGHSSGEGEIEIVLKDCGLVLKGTSFSLVVDDQKMKLDMLLGAVLLKFNKSGETKEIVEGESVTSDFASVTGRSAVNREAVNKQWNEIASETPGTRITNFRDQPAEKQGWRKYLENKMVLIGAGTLLVLILLLILILFIRRHKRQKRKAQPLADTVEPANQPIVQPVQQEPQPAPAAGTMKFCPSCGNPLVPGTRFCGKCGFRLK